MLVFACSSMTFTSTTESLNQHVTSSAAIESYLSRDRKEGDLRQSRQMFTKKTDHRSHCHQGESIYQEMLGRKRLWGHTWVREAVRGGCCLLAFMKYLCNVLHKFSWFFGKMRYTDDGTGCWIRYILYPVLRSYIIRTLPKNSAGHYSLVSDHTHKHIHSCLKDGKRGKIYG